MVGRDGRRYREGALFKSATWGTGGASSSVFGVFALRTERYRENLAGCTVVDVIVEDSITPLSDAI